MLIQKQKCRLKRTGIFATKLKTKNKLKINSLGKTHHVLKMFKIFNFFNFSVFRSKRLLMEYLPKWLQII